AFNSGVGPNGAIYSTAGGALAPVAVTTQPSVVFPPGTFFPHFIHLDSPLVNGNGRTAFRADFANVVKDQFPHQVLVTEDGMGGLDMVPQTGDQAPSLSSGVVFAEIREVYGFNDAGRLAFAARLAGPGITSEVNDA